MKIITNKTHKNNNKRLTDYNKTTGKYIDWDEKKANNQVFSRLLYEVYNRAYNLDYDTSIYTRLDKEGKITPLVSIKTCHNVKDCGRELIYATDTVTHDKKLFKARFCTHRLCPMCNWRKSLKLFGQVSQITDYISDNFNNAGYLFLTLTIKNCTYDKINETINNLNKAYQKIFGKKHLKKFGKIHKSLLGSLKFTEITYNEKTDTYHPHIHAVLCIDNNKYKGKDYITQAGYQRMWRQALKLDYKPMVNIKRIDTTKRAKAVAEVSKYPVKTDFMLSENKISNDKKVEVLAKLLKTLRGKRFISFYGIFSDVRKLLKLEDIETGNLVNTDNKDDDIVLNNVGYELYSYDYKAGIYLFTHQLDLNDRRIKEIDMPAIPPRYIDN